MDVLQAFTEGREVPPSPSGGARLRVRCYTDPGRSRWSHHDVHVHADWSAEVPHDLEAERVLAALGGYCSCLELLERTLPAASERLHRLLRQSLPDLVRGRAGRWRCRRAVPGCCSPSDTCASPEDAAEHWRSPRHVAAAFGASPDAVRAVSRQLLRARQLSEPVPHPPDAVAATARCLLEPRSAVDLWRAGVPPELVVLVHERVAVAGRALPAGFYLGVLTKRPDLAWIRGAAEQVPEQDVHEWLAWSETAADRRDPGLRAAWLRAGVSRRDVEVLSGAGVTPPQVHALAAGLGRTGAAAGRLLARWAAAGCPVSGDDLLALHRLAAPALDAVNGAAVERLQLLTRARWSTAELGTALAVCGTAPFAAAALEETGSADPAALTAWSRSRAERPADRPADSRRATADA